MKEKSKKEELKENVLLKKSSKKLISKIILLKNLLKKLINRFCKRGFKRYIENLSPISF